MKIIKQKCGGEYVVFDKITGNYKQSGKVMDEIYYKLLNNDKIETFKGFGIYYDNPRTTPTTELRSDVGCILENPDEKTLSTLKEKYKIKKLDTKDYLTAEIPYRSKFSILIGIFTVYPALSRYSKKHKIKTGAITEIYDVPGKKIYYRAEITTK
jgi:hypothetical protein